MKGVRKRCCPTIPDKLQAEACQLHAVVGLQGGKPLPGS
jgi:hypothetical protein